MSVSRETAQRMAARAAAAGLPTLAARYRRRAAADTPGAAMSTEDTQHTLGYDQGWNDGTHPSGVVTHASHRDPEAWATYSPAWQQGYAHGWAAARGEPVEEPAPASAPDTTVAEDGMGHPGVGFNQLGGGRLEVVLRWPNGDVMKVTPEEDGWVQVYVAGGVPRRDAVAVWPQAANVVRMRIGDRK